MVIKVYVALISCSQEVKKNQQRALMILESKNIPYIAIDITDPGQEEAKDYMLATASAKPGGKVPIPPQMFNEADYCGDFDTLDMSNECDSLGDFLKLTDDEKKVVKIGITGILPEDRQRAREEEQNAKQTPTSLTNGVSNNSTEDKQDAPAESTTIADSTPVATEESPAEASEAPAEVDSAPSEAEAAPTPEAEAAPTPDAEAAPTPEAETAPTPETETAPTPEAETAATPDAEAVPTPEVETAPTPEGEA